MSPQHLTDTIGKCDMIDVSTIVRQIGTPPGDPGLKLTPNNKALVQQWMIAQGLDAARVEGARESTIRKAYTQPRYLRHLKSRRDYNPAVDRSIQRVEDPAITVQEVKPPTMEPDPVKTLAAALQSIVQPGVSEDRVLQLIYDHVPGLIKLALAEMFSDMAAKLSDEE